MRRKYLQIGCSDPKFRPQITHIQTGVPNGRLQKYHFFQFGKPKICILWVIWFMLQFYFLFYLIGWHMHGVALNWHWLLLKISVQQSWYMCNIKFKYEIRNLLIMILFSGETLKVDGAQSLYTSLYSIPKHNKLSSWQWENW